MNKGVDIFSLAGRTALVTGATGHLGKAMAFSLAEAGAHVVVNGRNNQRVDSVVQELTDAGFSAERAVFDVSVDEQIQDFFLSWGDKAIHILINNAYVGEAGTITNSKASLYRESYEVSVVAAHKLLRLGLPALRKAVSASGDASVINVASMYGMVSPDLRIYDKPEGANPPFYGAAKAALLQWTRYAACEFGGEGIRVNSISPGPFPSPSAQQANSAFIDKLKSKVPLGRIGVPDELKGPALFLASPASSFVNGANLVVDGGWTVW